MSNKVLGGGYTCSNCGKYHRTTTVCNCEDRKKLPEKKSDKIPIAEEFFKEKYGIADRISTNNATLLAIEFAKLHVKAALEAASEGAQWKPRSLFATANLGKYSCEVDKTSILNAYPSHLIK